VDLVLRLAIFLIPKFEMRVPFLETRARVCVNHLWMKAVLLRQRITEKVLALPAVELRLLHGQKFNPDSRT